MAKSVMVKSAGQLPSVSTPRSSFNLSQGYKTTFDSDLIIPIYLQEVIPGDTFNVNVTSFIRLATPIYPIMDNLHAEIFFFEVPNRILWDNWEKMHGQQDDITDSIDFTVPTIETSGGSINGTNWTIGNYYGLPYKNGISDTDVSALPFRGYNKIYNDWFRDQALVSIASLTAETTGDGPDDTTLYQLQARAKRTDYFTGNLPAPQRGESADLLADIFVNQGTDGSIGIWRDNVDPAVPRKIDTDLATADVSASIATENQIMYAKININELREAHVLQKLLETDARSGTRFVEMVKAHYGVTIPDFRLQRSEYLGGGSTRINITPVANTAPNSDVASRNQGDLAGFGVGSGRAGFTKSFVEHGYIHGFINVRADLTYTQGLPRHFSRSTRYDFYYPALANLGEQATLNKEIWYSTVPATDDAAFGYNPRWEEMRYGKSMITGKFQSDQVDPLDSWHLSEDFSTLPTLGSAFIYSSTRVPLDRAIAVPTEPQFIGDFYFDVKAARPMPVHSIPGMRGAL